jgi:hypothetical protein
VISIVVFVVITPAIGVTNRSSRGGEVAGILPRVYPLSLMPPSMVVNMPVDEWKPPKVLTPRSSGAGALLLKTSALRVNAYISTSSQPHANDDLSEIIIGTG